MLKVGEVAVYPGHGVGRIESIEEKVISGTRQSFYIMRILDSDMTIMIPVDSAQHAGLRYVIDSEQVLKVLRDPEGQEHSSTIRLRGTGGIRSIWSGSRAAPSSRSPWC